MTHRRRDAVLLCFVLGLGALLAGCPGGKEKKKNGGKKRADYNQKWADIEEIGQMGRFDIKEGRKLVAQGQEEEGYGKIVEGIQGIRRASEEADKFFETMRKLYPSVDIGGYEDEVADWVRDMMHAKKSLPLQYADRLN